MKKQVKKIVVRNVTINAEQCGKVKFRVKSRSRTVVASAKGHDNIIVSQTANGKFEAREDCKRFNKNVQRARTPDRAFAKGVRQFWS